MPPRTDDKSVADSEDLLRRIWNKTQWISTKDGQLRPSSTAFTDELEEVSVFVASQKTAQDALEGFPDFGLVSIKAGVPRSVGLIVAATPEVEDPAHRVICEAPDPDLTIGRKGKARQMAKAVTWIVKPLNYRDQS